MKSDILHTYIIAEAGVNHNGSIELAIELIDVACEAGADAVKFQSFKSENLVSKSALKAEYQRRTTDKNESQFDMIKRLELDVDSHLKLQKYCTERGIEFLSTPFDNESLDLLANNMDLSLIKISSGDLTNAPLLYEAARTDKPVILSTGMSTLADIEQALGVLAMGYVNTDVLPSREAIRNAFISQQGQQLLRQKVSLLHCTTEYPAPFLEVNLRAMDTLRASFGLPVGFSDHTQGIAVPVAAVARGATIIEKHFTLDRDFPGPDHKASLMPDELKLMIQAIRQVEVSLGSGIKLVSESEFKNINVARKSLVALMNIRKGEIFTFENLGVKRPGGGIEPIDYWEVLGQVANKDYLVDEFISL